MQEPFTGVIYLKGSGIDGTFESLKGKRVGYVVSADIPTASLCVHHF